MTLSPLGDSAVVMTLGATIDDATAAKVQALARELERHPPTGVSDIVPAFASVAVFYDVAAVGGYVELTEELQRLAARAEEAVLADEGQARRVEIPVRYGGSEGGDLTELAAQKRLTPEQIVALHTGATYRVHAIGFVPGFPYLGGLPEQLATPRRTTPRPSVPAGSVGIGGAQTGVYPHTTPGGWNLIGRTPVRLFDARRTPASLLRAGDRVAFRAIEEAEFTQLEAAARDGVAAANSTNDTKPTPGIRVLRAGMFTTVQDLGRRGHRAEGVPLSGAADVVALRVANLLVGNPDGAAGLEFTLVGPELEFLHDAVIAFAGADFSRLPRWQTLRVTAGTKLDLGRAASGCRGYLAVAGGIDVPLELGSRSTYGRAQLGGHEGRALRDGDMLPVPLRERVVEGHWHIDERILPEYSAAPVLRILPGAQAAEFDPAWSAGEFKVSAQSDRMGARLKGPAVTRARGSDLLSSAVAPGTVQVPPDGQPIILLADAQTLGGYPQIAHVISADLPLAAQLRPGDTVHFRVVTLEEAHEVALAQEHALAMLREGLAQKLH